MAHELAHTVQQRDVDLSAHDAVALATRDSPEELAADNVAGQVQRGSVIASHAMLPPMSSLKIQRSGSAEASHAEAQLTAPLDISLLFREQRELVVNYILPELLLAISKREIESKSPEGVLKYEQGNKLKIELSGKSSVVTYHCTDLVMNSAFLAGYDVPSGGTGYYLPAEKMRQRAEAQRIDDIIVKVPLPADDPKTADDESKANLRSGDVMAWGPRRDEAYGHTMLIVEKGNKAGIVTVREAGTSVHERSERPLFPANRKSVVYRFTSPNLARIQASYNEDTEYRAMFDAAFERHFDRVVSSDAGHEIGRYRLISRP